MPRVVSMVGCKQGVKAGVVGVADGTSPTLAGAVTGVAGEGRGAEAQVVAGNWAWEMAVEAWGREGITSEHACLRLQVLQHEAASCAAGHT
jgi:hypothetical protein